MSVYVDEPRTVWPKRPGWRYDKACHLWAESTAELESTARELGLRKSWRHGDHYDLTENKRREAIQAGAIPVTTRELIRLRRKQDVQAEP